MPSLPNPLGPYRLERKLGGGGFADVYLAFDARRRHQVALKVLLPHHANSVEVRRRFEREGEQMLKLRHPHIVAAYEAGQVDGRYFIAMEYMPGGSLADLLERRRPLDLATAAAIVAQVAAALDYVHPNIIHRDLKPRNILFDAAGTAKVADFGIARVVNQTTLTGAGQILGTPQYMAPEQANPRLAPISPATDTWAVGVVLYEMLCGRPPFDADDPSAVLYQVVHETPSRATALNPGLPREVEKILIIALAKDPRQRYQRAGRMASDLRGLVRQIAPATPRPTRTGAPTPTPTPRAITPTPQPQRTPVLLGVAGILAIFAILMWLLLRPASPPTTPTPRTKAATPVVIARTTASPTRQHSTTSTRLLNSPTPSPAVVPAHSTSVVASPTHPVTPTPPPLTLTSTPTPGPTCPPYLHKPLPGMGLLLIENHIGEPMHIDHVGTGQKWDISAKQGDTPGRLLLDLPPGHHVLVDNTPGGNGRIGVDITPGSAFISPIWYNARTEEFVHPLDIPTSCR